jgi:hypothetical protein
VDTCLRVLVPEGEEPIDQKETASSTLLKIERAEETTSGSFRTRARSDVLENLCPKCGIQMDKAEADRWRKIAGRGDYIRIPIRYMQRLCDEHSSLSIVRPGLIWDCQHTHVAAYSLPGLDSWIGALIFCSIAKRSW